MLNIDEIRNSVINGHVLPVLKNIPDNSVDCVITSPPYYGLRNYSTIPFIWDDDNSCSHEWIDIKKTQSGGPGFKQDTSKGTWFNTTVQYCSKCAAYKGELGLEPFFGDHFETINNKSLRFKGFISHLADIFDEVKRILKPSGCFFLNIGDTYGGSNNTVDSDVGEFFKNKELPDKCLSMIPQRIAIEMVNRGWILRNHIVWYKSNAFPSPAIDRFSADWEDVFFFTKNKQYYFEQQLEPCSSENKEQGMLNFEDESISTRNKRCVWVIPVQPFSAKKVGIAHTDHFAAFPFELVETPIKAGCPKSVCVKCGTPKSDTPCKCNAEFKPGIVLDIFMGTGTTAVVAESQGVNWLGIEYNRQYCDIIRRRLEVESKQSKVKIIDIDGEKSKDETTCENCGEAFCMLRESGEVCQRWHSK